MNMQMRKLEDCVADFEWNIKLFHNPETATGYYVFKARIDQIRPELEKGNILLLYLFY